MWFKTCKSLSVNPTYHSLLLRGLVSIPKMNAGDTVWWHPDVVHAVEDHHSGNGYSNVVYVGSTPYCKKNLAYAKKQSQKFLEEKVHQILQLKIMKFSIKTELLLRI